MDDLDIHQHSSSSYDIMNDNYLVGYLATEYEVDKLLTNPDTLLKLKSKTKILKAIMVAPIRTLKEPLLKSCLKLKLN